MLEVTRIYGCQEIQKSMEAFRLSLDGKKMAIVVARGSVNSFDAVGGR